MPTSRERLDLLGGRRLPDPQRQRLRLLEPPPEAERAEPAVLVVDGGDPARRGDLQPGAHRLDVDVVGNAEIALVEAPRRLLPQDARRLAALVALDHAALHLEVAAGERERRRVEPERVAVLGDQRRGRARR